MRKQCEKCGLDMARAKPEDLGPSKKPGHLVTFNNSTKMSGHRHYCIKCHDTSFDCNDEDCEEVSEKQLWKERSEL